MKGFFYANIFLSIEQSQKLDKKTIWFLRIFLLTKLFVGDEITNPNLY